MTWEPYREPLRVTLLRTVGIAAAIGAALSLSWGGLSRWPGATLLALWPAFGGHWVELWFLNWLRPRLPEARAMQVMMRLAVWFIGGIALAGGMVLTARALALPMARWFDGGRGWWLAGLGFIGVELIAHLALLLMRRPSFYNGRG